MPEQGYSKKRGTLEEASIPAGFMFQIRLKVRQLNYQELSRVYVVDPPAMKMQPYQVPNGPVSQRLASAATLFSYEAVMVRSGTDAGD